jgi:hypothetical protein
MYHSQLREFIPSPVRVFILPYTGEKDDIGVRMHIGNQDLEKHLFNKSAPGFDRYYFTDYYPQILERFKFSTALFAEMMNPAPRFEYKDLDLLLRYENLPRECKNIDVLIINSSPRSGQYTPILHPQHRKFWNDYAFYLASQKGLNVITTEKHDTRVKCTADYNLTLKNIGALSTRAKVIIAVNTGPLSPCYNTFTLQNVRRIYMFHDSETHCHPKVVQLRLLNHVHPDEVASLCGGGGGGGGGA